MKAALKNCSVSAGLALLTASLLAVKAFSQDPNFYIFLAFGQSNMEGYPDQQEHQDSINIPARFQTMPAVDWPDGSRTEGTWTAAVPPLCRNTTGLCPCDYFGRTLADSLPSTIKIGIINVAVAGCQIEMFDKNLYQTYLNQPSTASWLVAIADLYGGNPYQRLVDVAKMAQKDGVIKGILMHQGESGSMTGQWASEVSIVYHDLIQDLGLDSTKVPLLAGDFTNPNPGSPSMVWGLPKVIKNCYVISSLGDSVNSTGIHFSASGYRKLGTSYGDSMLVAFRKLGTGPTGIAASGNTIGYAIKNFVAVGPGKDLISFEIPRSAFVTLSAYTLAGREIGPLARSEFSAGEHSVTIGANAMPPGEIVLKLTSGPNSATRTILATER